MTVCLDFAVVLQSVLNILIIVHSITVEYHMMLLNSVMMKAKLY